MALMLEGLSKSNVNILISGGTGAGKTTLLNILSGYIPDTERIVTIEAAAELQMQQPHVVRMETSPVNTERIGSIEDASELQMQQPHGVRMETRPVNFESRVEISARALVRIALRMR